MKKFKQVLKNDKGFTLIEILVVIAIIAILFITLLPQIDNAQKKARETGVKTDFHTFQTAMESYSREVAGSGLTHTGLNKFLDKGMQVGDSNGVSTKISGKKDPWGQDYKVYVFGDTKGKTIVVKSVGVDETEENPSNIAGSDDFVLATSYYEGQVTTCSRGFDTNNIKSSNVTKNNCGVQIPAGTALSYASAD